MKERRPPSERKLEGRGTKKLTRNPNKGKKRRPLKTATDIERIKFTVGENGEPVRIGGFHYGDVYLGKIRFKGEQRTKKRRGKGGEGRVTSRKKWKRVAIKRFKDPMLKQYAGQEYENTMQDLRHAGVDIPKMGMVRLKKGSDFGSEVLAEDEWVQVSQLFGSSRKGSKIAANFDYNKSDGEFKSAEARDNAIRELTRLCNAGRNPNPDMLEPIQLKEGIDSIPFDIDEIAYVPHAEGGATLLLDTIDHVASRPFGKNSEGRKKADAEFKRLYEIALEEASPMMKDHLKERYRKHMISRELLRRGQ